MSKYGNFICDICGFEWYGLGEKCCKCNDKIENIFYDTFGPGAFHPDDWEEHEKEFFKLLKENIRVNQIKGSLSQGLESI